MQAGEIGVGEYLRASAPSDVGRSGADTADSDWRAPGIFQWRNLRGEDHGGFASEKNLTGPNDSTRQTAAPLLQKILGEMKWADHAGIADVPRWGDWPIDQADGSRPVRKPLKIDCDTGDMT